MQAHQCRLHSSVQETTAIRFMQNICTEIHAFIVFYRQNPMSRWIWMRNWKGSDPCCEKFHSALTSLGHISWSELIQQQCNNTVVERVQWKHSEPQCCISITRAANVAVRLLFSSLLKILLIKITEYHELYSSQQQNASCKHKWSCWQLFLTHVGILKWYFSIPEDTKIHIFY